MVTTTFHDARPTVAERHAVGRAARTQVPRGTHAAWEPVGDRAEAVDLLRAQEPVRLAELLPIRYGRMATSPWTYLRGSAAVMAHDLARTPDTGLQVQLCGDAHVLNFGIWATPERNLSFDLRDFDETHPGPFEWDVKRLATSLVVLARDEGLPDGVAHAAVIGAVRTYRERMREYAGMAELDIWYDHIHLADLLVHFDDHVADRIRENIEKRGRKRTSLGAFGKLTDVVDGRRRIVDDPPLLVHIDDPAALATAAGVFEQYQESLSDDRRHVLGRFRYVDVARKVVGVGSVGMRVFVLLLQGRDDEDPLFLQIKQAGPSVLEPHTEPCRYENQGQRVVCGQRLIQSSSDIFIGWTRIGPGDFYVRQLRDWKVIPEGPAIAPFLDRFASACGEVLARAHARTGDPVAIAAYLGGSSRFEEVIATFAERYADQTHLDHQRLLDAIAAGDIVAEPGW